jgi:hypothetical protein
MRSEKLARGTAAGSRGGALPGRVGASLVTDVTSAIGCLPGVTVMRNPVMRVRLPSGSYAWTGIGGEGAPDLHVEVALQGGIHACVWLECKSGTGELSDVQERWHAAAARTGRHVYVVPSVEHALAIVGSFQRGEVFRG